MGDVQIDFDPDRLELTISSNQPLPKVSVAHQVDSDILGKAAGGTRAPGPLVDPGARRNWHIDPRQVS
jgi:hypothetical protein